MIFQEHATPTVHFFFLVHFSIYAFTFTLAFFLYHKYGIFQQLKYKMTLGSVCSHSICTPQMAGGLTQILAPNLSGMLLWVALLGTCSDLQIVGHPLRILGVNIQLSRSLGSNASKLHFIYFFFLSMIIDVSDWFAPTLHIFIYAHLPDKFEICV